MAFKFLDTHNVVEALQQQEDTSRQRFQHLCDQIHEVLRRLPEPETVESQTAEPDPPPAAPATSVAESAVTRPPAQANDPAPDAPPVRTRNFDRADWISIVLGAQLAGDLALAAPCQALMAGLSQGDPRAMTLVGQLLLFRSAAAERYPQLLKDLGEAYYGWRAACPDDGRFEAALVAWLSETCAAYGVANSIERVQPGDRFDPVRHQAPQAGAEVADVLGWVVLRDNGKVYTRAAVTAR